MVGIVILNYNTWEESVKCVDSIDSNTTIPYRIYLVDNCSPVKASDEQMEELNRHHVEIIYNKNNSGYAAGNNVGLRRAYTDGCSSFIISNSDVILTENSIGEMLRFADSNPKIGIVGPIIYDREGSLQPIHMLSRLTAAGKIKNMMLSTPLRPVFKQFKDSFVMHGIPEKPLKVFGVSGCFFLITKDCYEQVFPFDEHTFLYEEEYILGCRLEEKGISAFILPSTSIIHAEAVSTGGMSKFSYQCLIDSEQYYLKEYLHAGFIARYIILVLRKIIWAVRYSSRNRNKRRCFDS